MLVKLTVFFTCILLIFCVFSCQKIQDWNCTCKVSGTPTLPNGGTYTTTISDATQNNAGDLCNNWGANQIASGTYTCNVTVK